MATPSLADCPTTAPGVDTCLDFQSTAGTLTIGSLNLSVGNAIEVRGGVSNSNAGITPPAGTNGFFGKKIAVPGGLLGSGPTIGVNKLTLKPQLAGSPSDISFDPGSLDLVVPLKFKVTNDLVGSKCFIGSDRNPILVDLTTGTTAPPAPNQPISGSLGSFGTGADGSLLITGNQHVDNTFGLPAAQGCGTLGVFNTIINQRLRLASAAGTNALVVTDDIAYGAA